MAYDQATAARVRQILSGRDDVVEMKLMGGLSFMVAGNMACAVSGRDGLLVRVGPEDIDAVLKEPHASRMKMGARTMSGFVRVDPAGYDTEATLKTWVQRGVDVAVARPKKKSATPRRPKR